MAIPSNFSLRYLFGAVLGGAVLLYSIVLIVSAMIIPATIPLHFSTGGTANQSAPSSSYVVAFAAVGVVLLLAFLAASLFVRRGPIEAISMPHADYWKAPGRQDQVRALLVQDIKNVFTGVFLLMTLILGSTTGSAIDDTDLLGSYVPFAVGLFVLFGFAYAIYVMVRRYNPPPGPQD